LEYDRDKLDEVVVGLFWLTMFEDHGVTRAWKSQDWDVMNRLFEKGWILDPKGKAKSVMVTEEGKKVAEEMFRKHFG
jgi:hypothetical protein